MKPFGFKILKNFLSRNFWNLIIYIISAMVIIYLYGISLLLFLILFLSNVFLLSKTIVNLFIFMNVTKQLRPKSLLIMVSGTVITSILSVWVFELKLILYILVLTFAIISLTFYRYKKL
jgi:hypothetical protein